MFHDLPPVKFADTLAAAAGRQGDPAGRNEVAAREASNLRGRRFLPRGPRRRLPLVRLALRAAARARLPVVHLRRVARGCARPARRCPRATTRRVFLASLAFVLGFTTVFVALGASASSIGALINDKLWILDQGRRRRGDPLRPAHDGAAEDQRALPSGADRREAQAGRPARRVRGRPRLRLRLDAVHRPDPRHRSWRSRRAKAPSRTAPRCCAVYSFGPRRAVPAPRRWRSIASSRRSSGSASTTA